MASHLRHNKILTTVSVQSVCYFLFPHSVLVPHVDGVSQSTINLSDILGVHADVISNRFFFPGAVEAFFSLLFHVRSTVLFGGYLGRPFPVLRVSGSARPRPIATDLGDYYYKY